MFIRTKTLSWAAAGVVLAGVAALAPARAQESVKIGLILPMTGGQASTGKQIDNAIKLYMQQHGDTVAGKKIEIILKDDGALPDKTKTAAQELIVNDKVSFIAGFGVTPAAAHDNVLVRMNMNALPLIDFLPGTESPGSWLHHSPDFSAVYGRGMASHASDDVNLDDGRDCRDRLIANLSLTADRLGIIIL